MACERFIEGPSCWHHPDLRLLNPKDPTTIDGLRALDDQDRERAYSRAMRAYGLSALALAIVWIVALFIWGPMPATMYPLAIAAPLGVLLPRWIRRKVAQRFRPRFGRWTGEDAYPELSDEELAAIEPYDDHTEPSLLSFLR